MEQMESSNMNQKGLSLPNSRPKLPTIHETEDNSLGAMDCHICLEMVEEPVVTFCGHLYCWPCLYKWMYVQTASSEMSEHQQQHSQCPVCKAHVSMDKMIPLYGRGLTSPRSSPNAGDGRSHELGIVIPQRPPSPRCDGGFLQQTVTSPTTTTINSRAVPQLHPRSNGNRNQDPVSGSVMDSSSSPTGNNNNNNNNNNMVHQHPVELTLFDVVLARMLGVSETALHSHVMSRTSPRMRRQLMKVDRSLSRVSLFLVCFIVFCLLLF